MGRRNGVEEININKFKIRSERPKLPQNRVFLEVRFRMNL